MHLGDSLQVSFYAFHTIVYIMIARHYFLRAALIKFQLYKHPLKKEIDKVSPQGNRSSHTRLTVHLCTFECANVNA